MLWTILAAVGGFWLGCTAVVVLVLPYLLRAAQQVQDAADAMDDTVQTIRDQRAQW